MGMAASQARFLSLTARKSNVEYEGQQINQERTALANESSNLYAQLSKLEVPAPPATSDFYKTVYTFKTNELTDSRVNFVYTLDDLKETPDGITARLSHNVKMYKNLATSITGAVADDNDPNHPAGSVNKVEEGKVSTDTPTSVYYNVNDAILSGKVFNTAGSTYAIFLEDAEKADATLKALDEQYATNKVDKADSQYVSEHQFEGDKEPKQYLSYVMVGDQKMYLTNGQLTKKEDEKYPDVGALACIKTIEQPVTDDYDVQRYEENDLGRVTSITINVPKTNEDGTTTTTPLTCKLECTSVQDEEAYEQAMRDYEYNQAKYNKQVSDLNAKTEAIQQKDKTLELELKQLDTEQNALKTELDAVQKVAKENVESTFKTFG